MRMASGQVYPESRELDSLPPWEQERLRPWRSPWTGLRAECFPRSGALRERHGSGFGV